MKRIYFLILLTIAVALQAVAQNRVVDLSVNHYIGKTTSTKQVITNGMKLLADASGNSKYYYRWQIKNNGPDSLKTGDTIMMNPPYSTGNVRYVFPATGTRISLPMNDEMGIIPVDGSGNEEVIELKPFAGITASGTNTSYQWCDSIWIRKGASNPPVTDPSTPPNNNDKICHTVELTFWLTGVNTITNEEDGFLLFPNPAKDQLTIRFDFGTSADATVIIRDITGKVVFNRHLGSNISGTRDFALDISALNSGLYMAELSYNDNKIVSKLNVQ